LIIRRKIFSFFSERERENRGVGTVDDEEREKGRMIWKRKKRCKEFFKSKFHERLLMKIYII
jgi:hypothetical protein